MTNVGISVRALGAGWAVQVGTLTAYQVMVVGNAVALAVAALILLGLPAVAPEPPADGPRWIAQRRSRHGSWYDPGHLRNRLGVPMRINRFSAAALLLLGTLAPVFVVAPAQAAYPVCNNQVKTYEYVVFGPDEGDTQTLQTSLPTASGNIDCRMGPGARGFSVVALQLALNDCFGAKLKLDGIYGTATYNTVGLLQAVRGLSVDGVYGPDTRNLVEWGYRPPNAPMSEPHWLCRLFWLPS